MDFALNVPRLLRQGRVLAVAALFAICTGCGDYYRPVAFPVTPTLPDPSSLHFSMIVAENMGDGGVQSAGSNSRIDVSGDTNVGVARVGLGPVHATLLPNGSRVYIANSLEDTVSSYSPSDATAVTTISLAAGSTPVFVHTTQNDTVYVANTANNPSDNGTVSVISTGNNVVTQNIPVGHNPVALAETPNGQKLYVVNRDDDNVTSINVVDKSVNGTIATGTTPIWAAVRSDNARLYVLNQGIGTISVIDTCLNTPGCSPTSDHSLNNRFAVEAGSNFMFYDKTLQRLYVTEPVSSRLAIFDVSKDPLSDLQAPLAEVDLSSVCPAGCTLAGVTALPDGSRVYVSSYQILSTCSRAGDTPPCITSRISVIKTPTNNIVSLAINAGQKSDVPVVSTCNAVRFRRFTAAAADNSRVFVSNCDAGSTAVIRTSDDTHVVDLMAPYSAASPTSATNTPPPQNPVFVLAGR